MLDGVYVGQNLTFVPLTSEKGEGGEARIYDYMPGLALRILKLPDDPIVLQIPGGAEAAQQKVDELQQKLPRFPRGLPENVLGPIEPAYVDKRGRSIVGHTMRFIEDAITLKEYSDRDVQSTSGISHDDVVAMYIALHNTVQRLHPRFVLGDFNPLNVLVKGSDHFVIDALSAQFPGFNCLAFLPRYVDPLNCKEGKNGTIDLFRPHSVDSDWYSFAVMLFESLLHVHPYDGTFRPKNLADKVVPDLRPLKRISVFHPEVGYPSGGIPWTHLSDDMISFYKGLFERDVRGVFDVRLLESMKWKKCSSCGAEHARMRCPECSLSAVVKAVVEAQFMSESVFSTKGVLIRAAFGKDGLTYVYFENGRFLRNGDVPLCSGALGQDLKIRVRGDDVIIAQNGKTVLYPGQAISGAGSPGPLAGVAEVSIAADRYRGAQQVFDANDRHYYWVEQGKLFRESEHGPVMLTQVLRRQTNIWVGSSFGFGFFRASGFQRAFLFDAENPGETIVDLPSFTGRVLDIQCSFTEELLWLFIALEDQSTLVNRCFVIDRNGIVVAEESAHPGDGTWLQALTGKVAAAHGGKEFLLSATDEDVVRLEVVERGISEVASFKGLYRARECKRSFTVFA